MLNTFLIAASIALPLAAQTYEADLVKKREEYVQKMSKPRTDGVKSNFNRMVNEIRTVKGVKHACLLIYSEAWTLESVDNMKYWHTMSWQKEFGYDEVWFMNEGQKEPYATFVVRNPR
jgi:hypothetical protein